MTVQEVRIFDILILGPLMIFIGAKYSALPMGARLFLVIAGTLTIAYNLRGFYKQRLEK